MGWEDDYSYEEAEEVETEACICEECNVQFEGYGGDILCPECLNSDDEE